MDHSARMFDPRTLPSHPFTTAEARSIGLTGDELTAAVAARDLQRPFRGVYAPGGPELGTERRAQAAALVLGPSSVLCDRSAAWLHGVDVLRYAELDLVPPLETCVLRGKRATERPECAGRERDLSPEDIMEVHGVPTTTPLRTALDLACRLRRREALASLDAFMRHQGVTQWEMRRLLRRYRRRRGVVQARQLVPLADPRAESPGESWTRLVIHDHGFPRPVPQHWVVVDGVPTYRLDLAYPRAKVAVEYDGSEFHSSRADRAADRRRRAWLRRRGWRIIVLTRESFSREAVAAWTAELAECLAEAVA